MLLSVDAVIIKSKYRSHSPTLTTTYPTMSGRGKGKGLGKGGAKCHRKVIRDNIQGITKSAIHCRAHRGGVKCISSLIYDSWCPQGLPWECHQGLGYLQSTRGGRLSLSWTLSTLLMWGEDQITMVVVWYVRHPKQVSWFRPDLFKFLLWLCREGREREKTLTLHCPPPFELLLFWKYCLSPLYMNNLQDWNTM